MRFEFFEEVLDFFNKTVLASELEGRDINKANNVGFRVYDQGMVIYEQNKFRLSAYYHKCYVLTDDNHTRPLEFWLLTIILLHALNFVVNGLRDLTEITLQCQS